MKMDDLISRAAVWDLVGDMAVTVRPGSKLESVIKRFSNAIDSAPAVDAVPVVHGRWIDENPDDYLDPRMRCSICTGVESPLIKWRYCPDCGAKMDKERRESE